jgi:hypothetical protein
MEGTKSVPAKPNNDDDDDTPLPAGSRIPVPRPRPRVHSDEMETATTTRAVVFRTSLPEKPRQGQINHDDAGADSPRRAIDLICGCWSWSRRVSDSTSSSPAGQPSWWWSTEEAAWCLPFRDLRAAFAANIPTSLFAIALSGKLRSYMLFPSLLPLVLCGHGFKTIDMFFFFCIPIKNVEMSRYVLKLFQNLRNFLYFAKRYIYNY